MFNLFSGALRDLRLTEGLIVRGDELGNANEALHHAPSPKVSIAHPWAMEHIS